MVYLVHHTLNRNRTYTGGKRNPLPFDQKSLTDKSKHKTNSETYKSTLFFPFKTSGWMCDFECPIHGIINSGEIAGACFGRVFSFFWPKKLHNDFSENIFSNFERGIITCFIDALFRFFTILCFLKSRQHPGWSVRTLDTVYLANDILHCTKVLCRYLWVRPHRYLIIKSHRTVSNSIWISLCPKLSPFALNI